MDPSRAIVDEKQPLPNQTLQISGKAIPWSDVKDFLFYGIFEVDFSLIPVINPFQSHPLIEWTGTINHIQLSSGVSNSLRESKSFKIF
jgi:hypothetical protein